MANVASTGIHREKKKPKHGVGAPISLDETRPGRVIVRWGTVPIALHVWVHERPLVAWWIGKGELAEEASLSELAH